MIATFVALWRWAWEIIIRRPLSVYFLLYSVMALGNGL